jgi:hypothetical protein
VAVGGPYDPLRPVVCIDEQPKQLSPRGVRPHYCIGVA